MAAPHRVIAFILLAGILLFPAIELAAQESKKRVSRRANRIVVNDPNLWNYSIINIWENPALAGENRRHNITADLNSEPSVYGINLGYDFLPIPFKKSMAAGFGAYYLRDTYTAFSNSTITKNTVGIAGSFKYQFKNETVLSAGLSLGLSQEKSGYYQSFYFSNTYSNNNNHYPWGKKSLNILEMKSGMVINWKPIS